MKIYRVTQALYPYVVGGSPIHCHELSYYQSKKNYQVTVLTPKRNSKTKGLTINYNLKQFKWFRMPWDFFGMENPICPGLWWELLRSDFDLLHTHSHLFFTTFFSVIISKIKNKPSVVTVHGVKAVRNKATNLFQEFWLQVLSRYIFKMSDKIICLTKADAEEIKNYGADAEKIEIISNGINTQLFSPCDYHNNYILWVGRFVEEKGLKYLVDAVGDIIEDFLNKKFVLVGEGPLRGEIEARIYKKNLSKFFEIRNNCLQEEIAKLMKECELFVLPSLQEGFPKSLLEAMACGKPVITTNGLKEIVGDAGITVTPGSVEELKTALKTFLSDPSKEKRSGEQGRKYVERNWSWDIVSKKIDVVYMSLLSDE